MSLEADLERARDLDVATLADAIESIGFECTRCGACCTAHDPGDAGREEAEGAGGGELGDGDGAGTGGSDEGAADRTGDGTDGGDDDGTGDAADRTGDGTGDGVEPHTATVFPDEARTLQEATGGAWRDVARPMPYGLRETPAGPTGETFEWALTTDDCGDCSFYAEEDGTGACTVHPDRPLVCRTYPFSVALEGTTQPLGEAVDEAGVVRAHECEGLGREIDRADAEALARTLKERAVRELEEAVRVRDRYEPADPDEGEVVVHDSEGAKRPDGRPR